MTDLMTKQYDELVGRLEARASFQEALAAKHPAYHTEASKSAADLRAILADHKAQADTITRLQNELEERDLSKRLSVYVIEDDEGTIRLNFDGVRITTADALSERGVALIKLGNAISPAATINPPADPDTAGTGEELRGSAVVSRAATSDGPASPATSVPSGPLAQRLVELIQTIKDLSCPTARIERPRHNLDEVWGIADELMGRLPAALTALSAAPEAG